MINFFDKNLGKKLSKNFNSNEFDCRCSKCDETYIDNELVEFLQSLRDKIKTPIVITNAYRCKAHNEYLIREGYLASRKSQHLKGRAADLVLPHGMHVDDFANMAIKIGFRGVGKYDWGIHVDVRRAKNLAQWDYRKLR
ncbi:MAG: peptidase M15 [Candidatus Aenigmatarchaeota archaeon]|nr:MAG: peptidase M15 [Candidatus Aenigmarchaeota archaeon]